MRRNDSSSIFLLVLLLQSSTKAAETKLLSEEEFSDWIDQHMDSDKSNTSVRSLSRMLLAFQALDKLGDRKLFRPARTARGTATSSKETIKNLIRKDNPPGSKVLGLRDGDSDKVGIQLDRNPGQAVLGVATDQISADTISEGAADALSEYLNRLIQKEQALLAEYGKGTIDDQFSYLVDLPENRLQQKLLPMFGLVNSGTLVNTTRALREKFCSPTMALPRRYTGNRAVINGPALELTLSSGKCEVKAGIGDDKLPFTFMKERDISCSGHHVSWTKTPMSISRREVLPEAFAAEECKVEREFGTDYEKVLYGGGPLLHFASIDDFVDAVVTKKYSFFEGIDVRGLGESVRLGGKLLSGKLGEFGKFSKDGREVLDVDRLGREQFNRDWKGLSEKLRGRKGSFRLLDKKDLGFWSALGPGRLLKDKKEFRKRKLSRLGLGRLRDVDFTSPLPAFPR